MSEWKKAEECLPDGTGYFLVATQGSGKLTIFDCLFEKTKGQFGDWVCMDSTDICGNVYLIDQWFPIEDVIYWMPLPKLPSEGGRNEKI